MVEEKTELMRKLGKKQLTLQLLEPLAAVPPALAAWQLALAKGGNELVYTFDASEAEDDSRGIAALLRGLGEAGVHFRDLHTTQSSLEDIFVSLVGERK